MYSGDIDSSAEIFNHDEDLIDGPAEDRPVLATMFAPVDGSDIIVPVDQDEPEGRILALTRKQGMRLLLVLAEQLGEGESVAAIRNRVI